MNYVKALHVLKNERLGEGIIRRKSWNKSTYVYITTESSVQVSRFKPETRSYLEVTEKDDALININEHIDFKNGSNIIVGYIPSKEDFDAEDWEYFEIEFYK